MTVKSAITKHIAKMQILDQVQNDNVFPIARECKVIPTVILAEARIFLNDRKKIPGQARNDTLFRVVILTKACPYENEDQNLPEGKENWKFGRWEVWLPSWKHQRYIFKNLFMYISIV